MTTRCTFVSGAVALGGAALLPCQAFAAERADVVVVGAGLAGLNAAAILAARGMRVIVLEASEQPGRRIRTVTTADGPIEVGASQVRRSYVRVIDLCRSHGLRVSRPDQVRRPPVERVDSYRQLGRQPVYQDGLVRVQTTPARHVENREIVNWPRRAINGSFGIHTGGLRE